MWIMQELSKPEDSVQVNLELPMKDGEDFEHACRDRVRDLYDRNLSCHGVRAVNEHHVELFR